MPNFEKKLRTAVTRPLVHPAVVDGTFTWDTMNLMTPVQRTFSLAPRNESCNLERPLLNNIVVNLNEDSWVVEMWR